MKIRQLILSSIWVRCPRLDLRSTQSWGWTSVGQTSRPGAQAGSTTQAGSQPGIGPYLRDCSCCWKHLKPFALFRKEKVWDEVGEPLTDHLRPCWVVTTCPLHLRMDCPPASSPHNHLDSGPPLLGLCHCYNNLSWGAWLGGSSQKWRSRQLCVFVSCSLWKVRRRQPWLGGRRVLGGQDPTCYAWVLAASGHDMSLPWVSQAPLWKICMRT